MPLAVLNFLRRVSFASAMLYMLARLHNMKLWRGKGALDADVSLGHYRDVVQRLWAACGGPLSGLVTTFAGSLQAGPGRDVAGQGSVPDVAVLCWAGCWGWERGAVC